MDFATEMKMIFFFEYGLLHLHSALSKKPNSQTANSSCMDNWNNSSQASAAACPNCRAELIAFFIDETDNARIIEPKLA